ncbi:replication factor A protein 3-like protein [Roseobacter sp. OBYS 0001]|uniref:replication factor A protein 3-like protein n=1 Tax=Roseobacter sp. OBYS 0001 TaxID=882651 RepID=UPI001C7EC399|nr:replication factor A protein 3-like protein [Roseobacter sp. OBYS 0001]
MSDAPPIINASDLKRNAGQIVRVAGEYRPEFNPRHRTLVEDANGNLTAAGCVVLLALADGTFVDLFDRPEDEGRTLHGKAVVVTGTLCAPDTNTGDASVAQAAPLFHMIGISSIALAE